VKIKNHIHFLYYKWVIFSDSGAIQTRNHSLEGCNPIFCFAMPVDLQTVPKTEEYFLLPSHCVSCPAKKIKSPTLEVGGMWMAY
jgi:hypothetical protein